MQLPRAAPAIRRSPLLVLYNLSALPNIPWYLF
ncbi:hypothetical protein [Asinibacterium sp. OR53]